VARYAVVPERSSISIEARSSVGPIHWRAVGPTGWIEMLVSGSTVETEPTPSARLELAIESLSSGNALYDAELQRRIDARRYPRAVIELREVAAVGDSPRYQLQGDLTFHGVTREVRGTVSTQFTANGGVRVDGEQIFDIRDFNVPSPTILMLKIFPDVRVRLDVEAQPVSASEGSP